VSRFRRLGSKLLRREEHHFVPTIAHWCPACASLHDFAVEEPFRNGARWTFDGNQDSPAFAPSMNISWGPNSRGQTSRCHYFLTGGQLQYLSDCTHRLAGQTVPLPDIPPESLRWMEEEI
jgi:hypothetical protein